MKCQNQKWNDVRDFTFRNKVHKQISIKNNQKPLTYKEKSNLNTQNEGDKLSRIKNKNKKNEIIQIQPIKSASISNKRKIPQINTNNYKNILSEENLINLMNKFMNYSLNKNNNKNKKKLIRNNIPEYKEERKENDTIDKKKRCMESLIKKGIMTEIKDLQKPKKETFKEKLTQKKKSFLEEIGIEANNITSFEDSTKENNKNDDHTNNNNNEGYNNYYFNTFTGISSTNKSIKYFSPKNNNDDLCLFDEEISFDKDCKKTPLKPKINQFEYIRKIERERSKIQTSPNYTSVHVSKPSSKFMKKYCSKSETLLNDSFRHKNEYKNNKENYAYSSINQKKKFNNNKINLNKMKKYSIKTADSHETKDEYPFSHRKTYRSPDELNKYIKSKKIKNKEIEERKIGKKNKELFVKYKNLCTLNNNFNNCYKKFSPKYYNTISIKYKTHTAGFGIKDKRRENTKILLSNESFKNNNNSTLIDANEYYLDILESKKLIIKNIYSKTETQFYPNKNKKKEDGLKNINEYFKKKERIKYKNQKELIKKISKKINDTLIKAKQIFSVEENNDNNNENENKENKANINNNNNDVEDKKDSNDDNINQINENEEIKEKNNKENKQRKDNENDKNNNEIIIIKKDVVEKVEDKKEDRIKDDENRNIPIIDKNGENIGNNKINKVQKNTGNINSNDKNKKKKEIDLNKLNTFKDIINLFLKKYIFKNLFDYYVKISIFEHYYKSISYFVAIFKKYPFIKIHEHYLISKVFPPLKELINPFIKRHKSYFLNKLKEPPKTIINNFLDDIFDINNIKKSQENNTNEIDMKNKDNKKKKKLIENENIKNIEKLFDEFSQNKINNLSDFSNEAPNNINTSNEFKKDKNINLDKNLIKDIIEDKDDKKDIPSKRNKDNNDNENVHIYEMMDLDQKIEDEKDTNEELVLIKNNNNKNDKSRNGLLINEDKNEKENFEKINGADTERADKIIDPKLIAEIEKIDIDKLTEEIIQKIIPSEISSKDTLLIPKKKFKYEIKLKRTRSNLSSGGLNSSADNLLKDKDSFDISGLSQLSLSDDLLDPNDSMMSIYTERSFFNKTIIDHKKNNLLYFYQKHIAPRLIKLIRNEIISKYDLIYDNISKPYINNSDKIMMSLILQDTDMLRDNFKSQNGNENICDIIDKSDILKRFEPINKKIRDHWKVKENKDKSKKAEIDYMEYDEYLNNCLIDCTIELINYERKYGENGNPLIWSSRMREIEFKYKKNEPKKLADFVCRNLKSFIKQKVGLIGREDDSTPSELINLERERRLKKIIRNELEEGDYLWKNLEMEETQLKVELSDCIMEQLYNEIIEILEHIQLNRNKAELYHYKSIYACEEMPKLSFQQTTTENIDQDDNDDIINGS